MYDEEMMSSDLHRALHHEAACSFFGSCIGSSRCYEMVVAVLMSSFGVTESYAEEVASLAHAEWVEAYS
jgi:hypothetical protein